MLRSSSVAKITRKVAGSVNTTLNISYPTVRTGCTWARRGGFSLVSKGFASAAMIGMAPKKLPRRGRPFLWGGVRHFSTSPRG